MLELAELVLNEVKKRFKTSSRIEIVDPVELHGKLFSEFPNKVPDVEKLATYLLWRARYPIIQSIRSSIEFIDKEYVSC